MVFGQDVRELASHRPVLAQQLRALRALHEVPVLRPHERVDGEVLLRRLAAEERGEVIRVELRRTRHPEERVRELEAASELRSG